MISLSRLGLALLALAVALPATAAEPAGPLPTGVVLRLGETRWRHPDGVYRFAVSPDGKRIATGGRDGTQRVWDAKTGKQLLVLTRHQSSMPSLTFLPDGKAIVSTNGADHLPVLRGVEALERTGNAEARQALAKLAEGPADGPLVREAKAALRRLSKNRGAE